MNNSYIAGLDIGGSHITAAIIDTKTRSILPGTLKRRKVDSKREAPFILNEWFETVAESFDTITNPPSRMGIAMPGPCDYEEGISLVRNQDKFDSLYGWNIKEYFSQRLAIPKKNIVMNNDASCFLQGEIYHSPPTPGQRVLGLTLGTGLGSARYLHEAEDADLWHTPFREGIAEDYLSTRWFRKRYLEITGKEIRNVKELADMAGNNNPVAAQLFREFGQSLGEFIVSIFPAESPGLLILGGNMARSWDLFFPAMKEQLDMLPADLDVRASTLCEYAILVGASSFCLNRLTEVRNNS